MSRRGQIAGRGLVLLAAGAALAGCAEKTQYQWSNYEDQVSDHFHGGAPEAEVVALEKGLQKIKAANGTVPPGYRAHLGFLYGVTGKDGEMARQFTEEKAAFPESSTYMDFLLGNARRKGN